jgi:hypothetical protein
MYLSDLSREYYLTKIIGSYLIRDHLKPNNCPLTLETSLLTDFQGSSENVLRMNEYGECVNYMATRDTICLSFLMSLFLRNSYPVLLTGMKISNREGISRLGRHLIINEANHF